MKKQSKPVTVGDLVTAKDLNILPKKEREEMIFVLRKIILDLNQQEIVMMNLQMEGAQRLRTVQFISNTRNRLRKMIWILCGDEIKDEVKEE